MATDWMQAVMTFLQLNGESRICPASRRSLATAFFPVLQLDGMVVLECELRVQPDTQPCVASLLNGMVLAPNLTVAVVGIFFLRNIAASVFPWSKATLLLAA